MTNSDRPTSGRAGSRSPTLAGSRSGVRHGPVPSTGGAADDAARAQGRARSLAPTSRRRRSRHTDRQFTAFLFLLPLLVYLVFGYAYPLARSVDLSVHDYDARAFVQGNAEFVGWDNYAEVISTRSFAQVAVNTALFVLVSLVFQYTIGLALAVFFPRHFPLSELMRALFLVPWLPVSAVTLLLGLIYTLKVVDIIWIMTTGGPGTSSTTFAIWSYREAFGTGQPDFSPASAVGNMLILVALGVGLVYIRFQRRIGQP